MLAGGAGFVACTEGPPHAAPPAPHSAQSYVRPYPAPFGYGSNLGYYGTAWADEQLAAAVRAAGGTTIRVSLPEAFLEKWGPNARRKAFAYYADSLGLRDLVCFVGEPAPAHRDPAAYPGCPEPSRLFANLYEPIWNPDSTVNPNNYYARYIYQLTQQYGANIRVWEVVNEPDYITGTQNKEWLKRAPEPAETPNTLAPIYCYIRTLRITWEVVKKYRPAAYVTPGGLGYPQYLDALLRYTDNPHEGTATAEFPATGGAYFDVLDYHVYPSYYLRRRDWRRAGRFAYTRNSDYAAAQVIEHRNGMAAVLRRHGYDGRTYPGKHFIVTETNISRRPADWRAGSDEMQRNFGIKALVLAQKYGLRQLHFYSLAEATDAPPPATPVSGPDEFKLMGLYENLNRDAPGHEKMTQLGQAFRATARLLQGLRYSDASTVALHLPVGVEGVAFAGAGRTVFVLWAKTQTDQSEVAAATYGFPTALHLAHLVQYPWNYAAAGTVAVPDPQRVALSGTPAFFVAEPPATVVLTK
ncbi:hypothetical protein [Hymenobacter terricola]|uniref:hypothetical protein n=1 Tax=Hymenobacter terricola TaxID=2819236 RepID=UPI001B316A09|nr:hypothetical protein [Hymenobacter terricola]